MAETLKQMYFGQPASMNATFTGVTSGSNTTDAATFTTASVTLTAGKLYLLSVSNTHGTSATAVSAVTGGAGVPTFTSRATTQFNTALSRVTVFTAIPSSNYTGTLTFNFSSVTQTGGAWSLVEVSGTDTAAANEGIVQAVTATGTGTAASLTLATNSVDGFNPVFGIFAGATTSFTPGGNFFEIHDVAYTTPSNALETEYSPNFVNTVNSTLASSVAWGGIGIELQFPNSSLTIYTSPSGTNATAILRSIQICNTSASSANFTMGIGGTALSRQLYSQFSIPAQGVHFANVNIVLNGAQVIQAIQGTSGALTAIISGVEL